MKRKWIALLLVLGMLGALWGCGEEKTTTLTGMVVSLEGTTLSIVESDGTMGNRGEGEGMTFPTNEDGSVSFEGFNPGNFNPENMEGFDPGSMEGFDPGSMEGFDPGSMEGFDPGSMEGFDPESFGGSMPQWGEGEMPEGFTMPEGFAPGDGSGEGFDPANRPDGFASLAENGETREVDITNAHISVEIDGGKASGTTEDLTPGAFVTITMNGKGEVTNILVSSRTSFRGGNQRGNS